MKEKVWKWTHRNGSRLVSGEGLLEGLEFVPNIVAELRDKGGA